MLLRRLRLPVQLAVLSLLLFALLGCSSGGIADGGCENALDRIDEISAALIEAKAAVDLFCASGRPPSADCDRAKKLVDSLIEDLAEAKGFALCICEETETEESIDARIDAALLRAAVDFESRRVG